MYGKVFVHRTLAYIFLYSFPAFIVGLAISDTYKANQMSNWFFWTIIISVVLFAIMTWIFWVTAKWTWSFYKYELRSEGFYRESGIIWKEYHHIPYSRIQNIDIYRGVWDRVFGLSYLSIQTASAMLPTHSHGGRLPGLSVSDAKQLREELMQRVNKLKSPRQHWSVSCFSFSFFCIESFYQVL